MPSGGQMRDFPAQEQDPFLGILLAEKSPITAHPPFTILVKNSSECLPNTAAILTSGNRRENYRSMPK